MSAGLVVLGAGPTGAVGALGDLGALVRAQDPAPPPGEGPEFGEASPVALLVTILLGIALIFLIRSMSKHLKRVPVSFDAPEDDAPTTPTTSTGRVEPSAPSAPSAPTEPPTATEAPTPPPVATEAGEARERAERSERSERSD